MVPSTNGDNGREATGRFAKGNAGGPGNPFASRVAALRILLLDAVSNDDLRAVIAKLVEQAKAGDLAAIRELLDRIMGKPLAGLAVALDAGDNVPLSIEERRAELLKIVERLKRRAESAEPPAPEVNLQDFRARLLEISQRLEVERQAASVQEQIEQPPQS